VGLRQGGDSLGKRPSWTAIELGLERFLELVNADPRVALEFERSRGEFFASRAAARAPRAELRHLEWFLLERPSVTLGAVPVVAWQEEWRSTLAEGLASDLSTAFLHSLPGAFEITSLGPAGGLWARDLFTLGELPLIGVEGAQAIEAGDLLVGRLFPAGTEAYVVSPAASIFRNPAVLAAVRQDLEQMRAARRGVLRVQQLELERLFHAHAQPFEPVSEPEQKRAQARNALLDLGLQPRQAERVLERLRAAAGAAEGRVVMEILNDLAFETGVDLSSARLVLIDLWDGERRSRLPARAERAGAPEAREALEAFDRGRAQGKDLEGLFRELARDLGVADDAEGEPDEEEDFGAPDFPGVVGAMVEEFLWETERELGRKRARAWGGLRALGRYAGDIGVFEELSRTRLLDFSARWLLDEGGLEGVAEAATVLEALAAFCQWCQERHDMPLAQEFGPTLALLRASVPRHLVLRRHVAAGGDSGAFRVVRIAPGRAVVRDSSGQERAVPLTSAQTEHLRDGDLVSLAFAGGAPALGRGYPPELAALLP
jgi:hypothetical protein